MTGRRWRQLLIIAAVLIMTFTPLNVQAASKRSKAVKAYREMLASGGWSAFSLISLDKDKIPELVAYRHQGYSSTSGNYCVYTYRKGRVVLVANMGYSFGYYKKKGVLFTVDSIVPRWGGEEYHILKNGKVNYRLIHVSSGSATGVPDGYMKANAAGTKRSGISAAKFRKLLKRATGNAKLIQSREMKFYQNTEENRNVMLK
ncbi:MAG: hypothetical protein Q4B01_03660 [Eubacteriales bacterium]|nr:hypothetical protein [Eubacteriales bacterium]